MDNKRSSLTENERCGLDSDDGGRKVAGMNSLGGSVGLNEGEVFVDVNDDSERAAEELFAREEEEQVDAESDGMLMFIKSLI
jgi:hypothetical protein